MARRRAGFVARSVRPAPQQIPGRLASDRPAVLVHQPVVERADQRQVVKVGSSPVTPPPKVMGLGEPAGAAPGEPALPVAVADLTDHPRRRLAAEASDPQHRAVPIFHDRLDPGVCTKGGGPTGGGSPDRPRPRTHRWLAAGRRGERGPRPWPDRARDRWRSEPSTAPPGRRPGEPTRTDRPLHPASPRSARPPVPGRSRSPGRTLRADRPPARTDVPRRSTTRRPPGSARSPGRR